MAQENTVSALALYRAIAGSAIAGSATADLATYEEWLNVVVGDLVLAGDAAKIPVIAGTGEGAQLSPEAGRTALLCSLVQCSSLYGRPLYSMRGIHAVLYGGSRASEWWRMVKASSLRHTPAWGVETAIPTAGRSAVEAWLRPAAVLAILARTPQRAVSRLLALDEVAVLYATQPALFYLGPIDLGPSDLSPSDLIRTDQIAFTWLDLGKGPVASLRELFDGLKLKGSFPGWAERRIDACKLLPVVDYMELTGASLDEAHISHTRYKKIEYMLTLPAMEKVVESLPKRQREKVAHPLYTPTEEN